MKRVTRAVFAGLAAGSGVLCLGFGVLAAWSWAYPHALWFERDGLTHHYSFDAAYGRANVSRSELPPPAADGWLCVLGGTRFGERLAPGLWVRTYYDGYVRGPADARDRLAREGAADGPVRSTAGFRYAEYGRYHVFLGYPVLLSAAVPLLWVRSHVRRRRARRLARLGLCGRCGYDLRASAGRCPECGTRVVAATGGRGPVGEAG